MIGVTITDKIPDGTGLAFDLKHLLGVIDKTASTLTWRVSSVEAIGPTSDELHRISDEATAVSGESLSRIAEGICQTIEGCFEAFEANDIAPRIRIRAVDGCAFDVEAEDRMILEKLRAAFRSVSELPT